VGYIKRVTFILLSSIIIIFLSGCDHTVLSGTVIVPKTQVNVGDIIPLKLNVPEELSGIHGVMWTIEPEGKGEIIEGDQIIKKFSEEEIQSFFGEEYNKDRIALFKAKKIGECSILVDGFYRQTNPQAITEINLEIR
jgi:hypothetical protein